MGVSLRSSSNDEGSSQVWYKVKCLSNRTSFQKDSILVGFKSLRTMGHDTKKISGLEGYKKNNKFPNITQKRNIQVPWMNCRISQPTEIIIWSSQNIQSLTITPTFNPWSPSVKRNVGFLCTIYVPPRLKGSRGRYQIQLLRNLDWRSSAFIKSLIAPKIVNNL